MLRVLIIDTGSNALDFAMRCLRAGHEVKWWDQPRKDGSRRRAGEGIVDKITDFDALWKKWVGWADLIYLPDNTHYLDRLEPYRRIGYPIFAGTPASAELELDRAVGQKAMKDHGIPIMVSKTFHDYDAAAAFVKRNPQFLVSKPSGDADKALSYVAHDAADLTYMLERWKANDKYRADARAHGFILQEKKTGCEMAVGGWFGPGGWSSWYCENWENKKLMDGDLGVATGEMGTTVRMVRRSKLADKVLTPITPLLEKMEYVGYIDNNCIIDDAGDPWPLEWTTRDGWPLRHNVQSLLKNADPAQWMVDMLQGRDTLKFTAGEVSISVVMACPDFPYSKITNKDVCGIPIYNATDFDHIHLSEVMLGDAPMLLGDKVVTLPMYVSAGDYWLIATGTGETITGARRSAYAAIRKVRAPNSPFYRLDIGRGRMIEQLPKVQKHGYATGLSF